MALAVSCARLRWLQKTGSTRAAASAAPTTSACRRPVADSGGSTHSAGRNCGESGRCCCPCRTNVSSTTPGRPTSSGRCSAVGGAAGGWRGAPGGDGEVGIGCEVDTATTVAKPAAGSAAAVRHDDRAALERAFLHLAVGVHRALERERLHGRAEQPAGAEVEPLDELPARPPVPRLQAVLVRDAEEVPREPAARD